MTRRVDYTVCPCPAWGLAKNTLNTHPPVHAPVLEGRTRENFRFCLVSAKIYQPLGCRPSKKAQLQPYQRAYVTQHTCPPISDVIVARGRNVWESNLYIKKKKLATTSTTPHKVLHTCYTYSAMVVS